MRYLALLLLALPCWGQIQELVNAYPLRTTMLEWRTKINANFSYLDAKAAGVTGYESAPTGSCSNYATGIVAAGTIYTCQNGTWGVLTFSQVYPGAGVAVSSGSAWGSSYSFSTSAALTENSDTYIASQKAIKSYVDTGLSGKAASNASTTVNGQSCTLGGTCAVPSMVGDSGSGGIAGLVPTPSAGDGAAGKFLKADGTWASAGSSTVTTQTVFRAAICAGGSGSVGMTIPAAGYPSAACVTGANSIYGVAQFADTETESVQDHFTLPASVTGNIDLDLYWRSNTTDNTKAAAWQLRTACVATGEVGDPSWNAAQKITSNATSVANQWVRATQTAVTQTGCAENEEFLFKLFRDPTDGSDTLGATAELISLRWTVRHN